MAVESAADRAVFLSVDDFGSAATYRTAAGAETPIAVVFDNPIGREFTDPGMQSAGPRARMRTADKPAAARGGQGTGDRITIAGVAYVPLGFDDDGTGMTVVRLRATSEG